MKPILQAEIAECGLACVGLVASHVGLAMKELLTTGLMSSIVVTYRPENSNSADRVGLFDEVVGALI